MKKYLRILIITTIITLLPMLVGVILWNQLPDQMPIHWNAEGEVDGWGGKAFVVFGLPVIMLAVQWLCTMGTFADPKKQNHPAKVLHLMFWIIPAISVLLFAVTYATALGKEVRIEKVLPVFMGLLFAVIGNYMPKCKQNYTIGIKIPWTLNNEENWNKTHRFAGWLWMICGVVIMLTGFLGGVWIFFGVALLMVLAPLVYSYILHRKGF